MIFDKRKLKHLTMWLVPALALLLVLTGCSKNQKELFTASMNMQDVKSMQTHTTMTFQLSSSGFEPDVQGQVDSVAKFLNNAKLYLEVKTSSNDQKTTNQTKAEINLVSQGVNIDIPCWVDADLTSDTPTILEFIKLPQMLKTSLPAQLASKDYMVISPSKATDSELKGMDLSKLTEFSKKFSEAERDFLTSYSERFSPEIDVINVGNQVVQTYGGPKEAQIYEVKLNDAQLKELIRYTVNNFAQDKEAMEFVKQYMDGILEITQSTDSTKALSELDQAFQEFDTNKSQFLTKFNSVMDQLNSFTLLGDKGLDLKYAISGGYCVQKSGTIDLAIDLAQINQLITALSPQESTDVKSKGILNLQIDFNTDISGLNSTLEIKTPEVNSDNSFNYMDLIKDESNKSSSAFEN